MQSTPFKIVARFTVIQKSILQGNLRGFPVYSITQLK